MGAGGASVDAADDGEIGPLTGLWAAYADMLPPSLILVAPPPHACSGIAVVIAGLGFVFFLLKIDSMNLMISFPLSLERLRGNS